MDVVLQKIYALQKTNQEIITRVESVQEVVTYNYWIEYDENGFMKLGEGVDKRKVSSITAEHKPTPKFKTDIWDVFNDKPDWSAKSWGDLKRLNVLILAIVEKFELLDKGNKKVASELEKYLHNLEEIQQSLGVVEEKTLSQRSRTIELTAEIKEINIKIKALFDSGVENRSKLDFMESTILTPEHKSKLREWYGPGWKLLYKASRDGWDANTFHSKCDNKGKTISVISHSNGAYLIGGFTTTSWDSSGVRYVTSPDASIFTLVNPKGVAPTKFRQNEGPSSIMCHPGYGPTFGSGHDIHISTAANSSRACYCNFPHFYADTTGYGRSLFDNGSFWSATEVEVFYIPS
eukprot:TRINITY_DN5700_c0_g1_i1.p1 TRINITY_DN5700_c0_g1~~TRINITY_DN5700_c0_g1_i1.p1  ORF type:complete len:361 (+),score=51.72 TRINITY_DN5700_c0_g1_i1:40-1083(+)